MFLFDRESIHRLRRSMILAWQAYVARRAERMQQQQAIEIHSAEQIRQREHQVMIAQIQRTHQALDQCCRPAFDDVCAVLFGRHVCVQQIVGMLEASHPEVVEKMLSLSPGYEIRLDGAVINHRTSRIKWSLKPSNVLCRALRAMDEGAPSASGYIISAHDVYLILSQPFCTELPNAILDLIESDQAGYIAKLYRQHMQHTMLPCIRHWS